MPFMKRLAALRRRQYNAEELVKSTKHILKQMLVEKGSFQTNVTKVNPADVSIAIPGVQTDFCGEHSLQSNLKRIILIFEEDFPKENECFKPQTKHLLELLLQSNIPYHLLKVLDVVSGDVRSDVVKLVNLIFQNGYSKLDTLVEIYVHTHEHKFLDLLLRLYPNQLLAVDVGSLLRQCLRRKDKVFAQHFFAKDISSFESLLRVKFSSHSDAIIADAYETLELILLDDDYTDLAVGHLVNNYSSIVRVFNELLQQDNVRATLAILRLLTKILFERKNYEFRCKYVEEGSNFCVVLKLLTSSEPEIEAFAYEIFKLFIVNPKKPNDIEIILSENKETLVGIIERESRKHGETCCGEVQELIAAMQELPNSTPECN